MKFKLVYVGEVKINPKKRSQHLQDIRDILSPQLKRLSEISPYNEIKSRLEKKGKAIKTVGGVKFFPLITPDLNLLAELDIQILHPELLETPRADIDNRMKTLLDALKRPQSSHEISEHMNKKDVCYVGDSLNDCLAAINAGITPILLDRDDEYLSSPYIRIKSLKELLD